MRKPLSKEDLRRRKEAIDKGQNSYVREDGTRYTIRNRNNPRHKKTYGGQGGRDERSSSRDRNRDSKTRLGITRRSRNERISTPKVRNKAQQTADYEKAKQSAKAAGKDHHHKTPVYLTGNALAKMSPRRRATYFRRMRRAGTATGNTGPNVSAETRGPKGSHRQAHKEGEALQNKLKIAERANPSPSLNRVSKASKLGKNRVAAPTPTSPNRRSLGSTGSGIRTSPITTGSKPSLSNVIKTMHGGRAIMHHSPLGMPIYKP